MITNSKYTPRNRKTVPSSAGPWLAHTLRRLWNVHPPLMLSGLLAALLTLFFIAGVFLDERVISGAPAWLKPTKFGISISVYTITLTWLLSLVDTGRRWRGLLVGAIGWIAAAAFSIEWFAIITQVARGTTSHFNLATPFDAALYSTMGAAISVLWSTNFLLAALLFMQRFESRAIAASVRFGLLIAIVGMGLGYLMTSPTALQMSQWQSGGPVSIVGAHSVGVRDGGAGLPLTGWSTEGGDLRIGHFVGMHALQIIPLLGWSLNRRRDLLPKARARLVGIGSGAYLAVTLLFTWQALRAQPITEPDLVTIASFAAILVLTAIAAAIVVQKGRTVARRESQRPVADAAIRG